MPTTVNKALREAIIERVVSSEGNASWGKFRHFKALQDMLLEFMLSGRMESFTTEEHNEFFASFTQISEMVFDLETLAAGTNQNIHASGADSEQ